MPTSFNAKDASGATIKIGADLDTINSIYYPINGEANFPSLTQAMSTVGDGTGTINILADLSLSSTDFYIEPPAGQFYDIKRLIGFVVDAGIQVEDYGANGTVLANGIKLIHEVNTVETELTYIDIISLYHWYQLCPSSKIVATGGDDVFVVCIDFGIALNSTIRLDGDTNDKLILRCVDDFTHLTAHNFSAQGHIIS